MKLSIILPFYPDPMEAISLLKSIHDSLTKPVEWEAVLVDLDARRHDKFNPDVLPRGITLIPYALFPGLPQAKNKAVASSSGEFVLFLYTGLRPHKGAIERLVQQLDAHPEWGAVAGRWTDACGRVEKGYNIRRFPTLAALMFDLLLINKLAGRNRITRAYKMHDFDHSAPLAVEHANDCVFMFRRELWSRGGGFSEKYFLGWFDQIEFCQTLRRHGHKIIYDPAAEFISNGREPLINRLVHEYYSEFYATEYLFVKSHFGAWSARLFRLGLIIGMSQRLLFALALPDALRKRLLARFRSYVGDDHIRRMRAAYWSALRAGIGNIR